MADGLLAAAVAHQALRVISSSLRVERFFALLTQKQIRRGVFTSVPHLEKCLREYLHSYKEKPRPLMWTKTVDEILEKVYRGRTALAEST